MRRIALRGQTASKPQTLICQFCRAPVSPAPRHRPLFARSYTTPIPLTRRSYIAQSSSKEPFKTSYTYPSLPQRRYRSSTPESTTQLDLNKTLNEIAHSVAEVRKSESVPSNDTVVQLLQRCQEVAEVIAQPEHEFTKNSPSGRADSNEISSLLNLEEKNPARKQSNSPRSVQPSVVDLLCQTAHDLLTDEKIFISPEALACYVKIHTLLKRPESFPEIFHLYANKPVPEENSSPVKLHRANPKDINSAVPTELANMGLDVAIEQRNLPLVLAIIDNTFCAPAFHRAKFFKKAAVPLGGLAAAPAACYVVASWAASFQNTMDPSTATGIAFAAILAYVGGTSSVGLLAITTANDHMERVVWLPGIPLRHRWLREEERAALDRVALAWGFKDEYMRGEEEGEEWESLREFIGMRGMILDKTDLMQGMQ